MVGVNRLVAALGEDEERARCVTHVAVTAATAGRHAPWPAWLPEWLTSGYGSLGVAQPWAHQVRFMERARDSHAVIATSTGSGKSLALWAPVLSALDEPYELGRIDQVRARPAAIYLAPTKALAADQFTALRALFTAADVEGIEVGVCDGDTPTEARRWLRSNVDVLLTNPDYLHFALLPGHTGWAGLLRGLRYVLIDELHAYRGVMGAHVAWVIRRLRRLARHYGADPIFLAASATVSEPAETLARLIGEAPETVTAVTEDTSARGDQTFVMWRPAPFDADEADTLVTTGKGGASGKGRRGIGGPRRSAAAETARLLAALTDVGARSVAFVRSRFAAETVAESARAVVGEPLAARIATYRGGYLAEERRGLEDRLRDGSLLGVVATSALELGIDVSGLDAVLIAGWPGTRVALKQRAGRAGRAGADGLAVWVAGTDPLDSYLVEHPDSVLGPPLEACVFDPSNVYVSAPHLAAATAELPLHVDELAALDAGAAAVLDSLAATGAVRRRGDRWFWLARERATDLTDLRGSGGGQIQVVEQATGQVLGTVDSARAPATVHPGAVYLHQGSSYVVTSLDLTDLTATVEPTKPSIRTRPLSESSVRIAQELQTVPGDLADWHFGMVDVTSQVTGYTRLRWPSQERLGSVPLDMPPSTLRTASAWLTIPNSTLKAAGLAVEAAPAALHAAEHTAIGLLGMFATCDRNDLGGLSTLIHADTGLATIFIHDAAPGGAGFAERAFHQRAALLEAVRDLLSACGCEDGCPSCVQSPKCGNANQVLSKTGALALVSLLTS